MQDLPWVAPATPLRGCGKHFGCTDNLIYPPTIRIFVGLAQQLNSEIPK
jgi:hypothetical protein